MTNLSSLIASAQKEQLQKFPAVSGFHWETYFASKLTEAWRAGRVSSYEEMKEAFLERGKDQGKRTIIWDAHEVVKVMDDLIENETSAPSTTEGGCEHGVPKGDGCYACAGAVEQPTHAEEDKGMGV